MAHDDTGRFQAHASDKIARVLTSDSAPQDGEQAGNQGGDSSSRAPIQEYSVERVEKVYRFVPPVSLPLPLPPPLSIPISMGRLWWLVNLPMPLTP